MSNENKSKLYSCYKCNCKLDLSSYDFSDEGLIEVVCESCGSINYFDPIEEAEKELSKKEISESEALRYIKLQVSFKEIIKDLPYEVRLDRAKIILNSYQTKCSTDKKKMTLGSLENYLKIVF